MIKKALILAGISLFSVASYASADPAAGEKFFNGGGKCKNCHQTNEKKKIGPGLKDVTKRASEEWLKAWLKDPPAVWKADDEYVKKLKVEMKKESKPTPTHKTDRKLTEEEVDDLLDYLKTL